MRDITREARVLEDARDAANDVSRKTAAVAHTLHLAGSPSETSRTMIDLGAAMSYFGYALGEYAKVMR